MSDEIAAALEVLASAVADKVVERLRGTPDSSWVDQHSSPIGPRRHVAAVKRRLSRAQGGAAIVGRKYMLDAEALQQELLAIGKGEPTSARTQTEPDSPAARLERKLGLVGGRDR